MSHKKVLQGIQGAPRLKVFWCPGCEFAHHIDASPGRWVWDDNEITPTVRPSLLINASGEGLGPRCHFFIREGQLQFLDDCTHELKGQTVPMVSVDSWP